MKRRDFGKLLLGLLGLPYVVRAEPLLKSDSAKVVEAKTRKLLGDKPLQVDWSRNTPEGATKYISGLYRDTKMPINYEIISTANFGLTPVRVLGTPTKQRPFDHYTISGEGKTKEEAWSNFWGDFAKQATRHGLFDWEGSKKKDIFWRSVVEEELLYNFDTVSVGNKVSCRFSLGDFT